MLWQEGDAGVTASPIPLEGHGVGTGSPENSEAVTYTKTVRREGRIVPVTVTLRGAIEMSVTYDFGIPAGLWTPVQHASFRGVNKTFFLEYVCPPEIEYDHFIVLENGSLSPFVEASDLITIEGTAEAIKGTVSVSVERRMTGWYLSHRPIYVEGSATPLYDVSFIGQDCYDPDVSVGLALVAGGGDGIASPLIIETQDRFASVSNPSVGAALDVIYTTYAEGTLHLVNAGDNTIPGSATTATTYRSTDDGVSYSAVADIDIVVHQFIRAGDSILAIGQTIAGAAAMWRSTDDGDSWTALSSSAFPVSEALTSGIFDPDTQKVYFGGASGTLLTGRLTSSGINLVDVTANLGGTPTAINAMVQMDTNGFVVCGASGVIKETWDGGVSFSVRSFPTTDDIVCADGNKYRLVLGAGTKIYERSFLTRNKIQEVELADGAAITGNVTGVSMNIGDDSNRFAACTDDGEIVFAAPNYPDA
jgi:hypothetical protein